MLVSATLMLRVLYCLAIIVALAPFPLMVSASLPFLSSRALVTGGGAVLLLTGLRPLVVLAVAALRLYAVVRHRGTLDAYVTGSLGALRRLGIWAMGIGTIVPIGVVTTGVILASIYKGEQHSGLLAFIGGVYGFELSSIGVAGCALFELSRLLGFEARMREDRRRAAAAVARAR